MYPVSDEYINRIMSNTAITDWYGQIVGADGTVYDFDSSMIAAGSGKITRQICTNDDIQIGTTCSSELSISLYLDADRYSLYGGTITLYFKLKMSGEAWETVPLGIFTISDPPTRNIDMVTIHAYDAMLKFNKDFGLSLNGSPYSLLSYACNACGVELGSTQTDIASMTNGLINTYTYDEMQIYTFRDFVGYVASYLCAFAYIGVDGKLYLKQYDMTSVRTISPDWRYSYIPQEYEAFYGVLTTYYAATGETETIVKDARGLTYDLGVHPLMQFNDESIRYSVITNIADKLITFAYTPFKAKTPADPALMVGDVLNFTGNHAVDGKLSVITKQVITINRGMELECVGSDPNLNVLTGVEKEIQTIAHNSNKDGMYYYDYVNADTLTIHDGESATIILFNYTTTKDTHVDFHAEIKAFVDTTEYYNEDTDTYTEHDGIINVSYRMEGAVVTEYFPIDTFFDGYHLLHLLYTWWANGGITSDFEVIIRCIGCSITVNRGAARGYIAGCGLIGDMAWTGDLFIRQDFVPYDFRRIAKNFTDAVDYEFYTPDESDYNEDMPYLSFARTILKPFNVSMKAGNLLLFTTESDDMETDNVMVRGSVWNVIDQSYDGTVSTPNCTLDAVVWVRSNHATVNGDVTYVVSFDDGDTWWYVFNGAWAQYESGYGMAEVIMENIPAADWAMKFNGTIKVKAILEGNSTLTDIQIFTEVIE